jgi:phage terminase small subunit
MKNKKTGGRHKGTPNKAREEAAMTVKQTRFVSEYLKDLNGAAAAVRAGYSPKTADRQAYALLRKPEISKAVAAAEARQLEVNKISATRTIEENRRIALSDPRSFFNAAGTLKPISEWTGEMAAAVSKIEVVTKNAAASGGCPDTIVKLWFWNTNKALELLSKDLGLREPKKDDARPTVPMFLMPPGSRIAIE